MKSTPARLTQLGHARLEFALTVAVTGVLITLALGALTRLQELGNEARRVTDSSQHAAASAVMQAHCQMPASSQASATDCPPPCPDFPPATPKPGTAPSPDHLARSCP